MLSFVGADIIRPPFYRIRWRGSLRFGRMISAPTGLARLNGRSDRLELPKRKPNRLKHYDYSQNGVYFITICTKDRHEFLWNAEADMRRPHETAPLSEYGEIIDRAIASVSRCYPDVKVDTYVIMPNHLHMILILSSGDGRMISAPTKDVSTIVGQLKRWVTQQTGFSLWQKSFHDHIIRNEHEYQMMWEYIDTNPIKWAEDCFYQHP